MASGLVVCPGPVVSGPFECPVVCIVTWLVVQFCVQVLWSVVHLSVQWPVVACEKFDCLVARLAV